MGMNHHNNRSTFHALNLSLDCIRSLNPTLARIRTRDGDLAKQLRRAATSIALNLGEGGRREGKDRLHSYRIAAGSADETRVCLLVAEAWGYLDSDAIAASLKLLDSLLAILWKLTH